MVERVTSHNMLTVEEYLKLEESATIRHEYVGGVIHAMVGTTKRHNRIAGNIYRRLADKAADGPCRVYMESVKVQADEDTIYYPDVMVACDPEDDDPLIEHQPCLIVEVTSPSTESIDRREKAFTYRKIPSLKAYLIVDQSRRWVERYWRDENGEWRQGGLADTGELPIPCPDMKLSLADIYEGL
ncbi:Uma2 family endonuclease [soil metagenome]|nr:Uma2 family endonuclease [Rubrobacter sp.]